jgi:DNA ligase (NAD+)
MHPDDLVSQLERYNLAYRNGQPLISDAEYDELVEQLRRLAPDHPFLHRVEPEQFAGRLEVRHPEPMLSTEKAYTREQLRRFVTRVEKEARAMGMDMEAVLFKVTPKLDGLAGRDDGNVFASRGNGLVGYEISSAFDKGVIALEGRGQGLGEIVVAQSYFDAHLADSFEHPRNMVVGIVSSDTINEDARQALEDQQVRFVPYRQLPYWQGTGEQLLEQIDGIGEELMAQCDYPLDGLVAEVVDEGLKARMGATTHHYRWQIAVKRKGETAETVVESVQWQVGRTGNVTPVLEVAPVNLSGATIRRVTAHHAGMVDKRRIGPGSRIEIIRSGEVIPKLEKVLSTSEQVELPEKCPACEHDLHWKGDFLRCGYTRCPAQIEQRISHWFRVLGSADWFGIKTIQKLVAQGFDSLEKIYALDAEAFAGMGFGPVQSRNLAEALAVSRAKPVEDWRFLAALGIPDLGVGDSRRLLEHVPLEEIVSVEPGAIARINGFGEITSRSIAEGIAEIKSTLLHMLALGFNLEKTPLLSEQASVQSPIAGKNVVFTGKMQGGSREAMQAQARQLGAIVQTAVSGNTDLLICGEKVGAAKMDKASRLGVKILTEAEYYQLIG